MEVITMAENIEFKPVEPIQFDRITFAKRLKEARSNAGLTQNELANLTNISTIMVSAYENPNAKSGKNPTLSNVFLLASALNVSIDWLCGNKPPMNYGDVINFLVEYDNQRSSNRTNNRGVTIDFIDVVNNFDILSEHVKSLREDEIECIQGFRCNMDFYDEECMIKEPFISLHCGEKFAKFLEEWTKIKDLHATGAIDSSLYKLWINQQLEKYNKIFVAPKPNTTQAGEP